MRHSPTLPDTLVYRPALQVRQYESTALTCDAPGLHATHAVHRTVMVPGVHSGHASPAYPPVVNELPTHCRHVLFSCRLPAGHATHAVRATLMVPAAQLSHAVALAANASHAPPPVLFTTPGAFTRTVRSPHTLHAVAAGPGLYRPASHTRQADAPAAMPYDPGGHAVTFALVPPATAT